METDRSAGAGLHFKPAVELYNLVEDPGEASNKLRLSLESSTFCGAGWSVGSLDVARPACRSIHHQGDGTGHEGWCVQDLTAGLRHTAHRRNPQRQAAGWQQRRGRSSRVIGDLGSLAGEPITNGSPC